MWIKDKQEYNKLVYLYNGEPKTLKDVLLNCMDLSIRSLCSAKRDGIFMINGIQAKAHHIVNDSDIVTVVLNDEGNEYLSQKFDLDVIYEDVDILAINKPPFMVVHPTKSHQENTLLNYAKFYFEENNICSKVRFINRLDRDTSGIVIIGKSQYAHSVMTKENSMWDMEKRYIALVSGVVAKDSDTIDLPIGKVNDGDLRRYVTSNGQNAITHYTVLKRFDDYTLVEVKLETGRTHQIRAHFEHIGHPLLGDELYGGDSRFINRQALHCYLMEFHSPRTGKICVKAKLPNDIKSLIE